MTSESKHRGLTLMKNFEIEHMDVEFAMELYELAEVIKFDYVRTIRIEVAAKRLIVTFTNKTVKEFDFIFAIYLQAHLNAGAKLSHGGKSGPAIMYA